MKTSRPIIDKWNKEYLGVNGYYIVHTPAPELTETAKTWKYIMNLRPQETASYSEKPFGTPVYAIKVIWKAQHRRHQ